MTSVALHGHAYQPPRADPRTGSLPADPAAAPYRDWNHRITAECYAPCTATRLHDEAGRVTAIVNLFEEMSFDLGPTLAHWLDREAPEVHARIVAADRVGRTAIAHPYHHAILPLCSAADARTEIRWGAADFRRRFAREPEGMWLPEAAVDVRIATLLAAEGIGFTLVAPHQVERLPAAGTVGCHGSLTLVVYDGPTSHDLAFGGALGSADAITDRLVAAAAGGFAVAATDLETFGHHHRFSERAVGHALFEEVPARGLRSGGLARLLDGVARTDVGRVLTSAWSCAHGVERWRADCGCVSDSRPDSHQRWRAPLRAALDLLRDHAHAVFARRGNSVFADPATARDAYGEVLADRGNWDEFVTAHVAPVASEEEASILLASQEATLASFTSCAWFFADLERPEVAIVLREATRSAELLSLLGEQPPMDEARALLGGGVWEWALEQDSVSAVGDGWTWDAATPVERLVARVALDAPREAAEVVELSRRSGEHRPFNTAQEIVYQALHDGRAGDTDLVQLGTALGLACELISRSRRST